MCDGRHTQILAERPVTVVGLIPAVVLMAGGVAIIGTASGPIVSLLNERTTQTRQSHGDNPDDSRG
ncbi:hypothetical protein GCM10009777_30500 [Microbacterium pumilum]|uniref:Uncharacterized protein n=1 Tax=Microbacterium pumilum TaxID=344165 RepID=A0ABP5E948_9MICO